MTSAPRTNPIEMSGWQPIETAPDDGTPILIGWADKHWHPQVAHMEDGVCGYLTEDMGFTACEDPPTHWMPLPEPPSPLPTSRDGGRMDMEGSPND